MPEVVKKTLSFKADPWLIDWLRKRAESESRTIGAMIRVLLEKMAGSSGRSKR